MENSVKNIIKKTILSFIPDARILLFGSRAGENFQKESDYDLLVITKKNFSAHEKFEWMGKLNFALVHALNSPVDVLVNSEDEVEKKQQLPGHVIRWALKEGIEL